MNCSIYISFFFSQFQADEFGDEMIQTRRDASSKTSIHLFFDSVFPSALITITIKVLPGAHFSRKLVR